MQLLKSIEHEKDCRIRGEFNNSTLAIACAVTNKVLKIIEKLDYIGIRDNTNHDKVIIKK